MIKDVPKVDSNVFILYSAATGVRNAELAQGITPRHVRNTCKVTSETPMTIVSGSSGYSRDGLSIVPVLSADRTTITFELTLTACNFSATASFYLRVNTAGDSSELEGVETSLKFYVICYGMDRVYLSNNYVEYRASKGGYYRVGLNPVSTNNLVTVGIAGNNLRDSGFVAYDRDDDMGDNQVYYAGVVTSPGVYGISVMAQTDIGDANDPGYIPNPFPAGGGTDAHIISIYPDYYNEGDVVLGVPKDVSIVFTQGSSAAGLPDAYRVEFGLFNGYVENNGGLFSPCAGESGKFNRWERKITKQIGTNTTETFEYRISHFRNPDTQSVEDLANWYLHKRYYLDTNDASWELLATVNTLELTVSILQGETTQRHTGICITPPYTGWKDTTTWGDSKYYVDGYGFFNSGYLWVSTINAYIPIWVGSERGVLLKKQQVENTELVAFPEYEDWAVLVNGVATPVEPEEVTCTVVPYAPPATNDTAIGICASPAGDSNNVDKLYTTHALNKDTTDLSIGFENVLGGLWRRYPLQRLVDPGWAAGLTAKISSTQKHGTDREELRYTWERSKGFVADERRIPRRIIHDIEGFTQYIYKDNINGVLTARLDTKVPLTGIITDKLGVKTVCGMAESDDFDLTIGSRERYSEQVSGSRSSAEEYSRVDADERKEVTHKVFDRNNEHGVNYTWKVPTTYGKFTWELTYVPEPSNYPKVTTIESYNESEAKGKGSGIADCYLHIGQGNTADGRRITEAASSYVSVSGSTTVPWTSTKKEIVDGEVTSEESQSGSYRTSAGVVASYAEAFPRLAYPNAIGGTTEPPDTDNRTSLGNKSYRISIQVNDVLGFTGHKYSLGVECEEVGEGEYSIQWTDPDGDRRTETHKVTCFGPVGSNEFEDDIIAERSGGDGEFSYNASNNTASCRMRIHPKRSYHCKSTITRREYVKALNPDDVRNPVYPFSNEEEETSSYEINDSYTSDYIIEISPRSDGKYTRKTTKPVTTKYKYKWHNPPQDDDGSEWEEGGEAEVIVDIVSTNPAAIRREFDAFMNSLPAKKSQPTHPDGDWDYWEEYAEYTDAAMYPDTHGCGYTYIYTSTENKPADLKVSIGDL